MALNFGVICSINLSHLIPQRSLVSKILVTSIMAFGFLNFSAYEGGLISGLMAKSYLELDSLDDLLNARGFKLFVQKGGSEAAMVEKPEFNALWQKYFEKSPDSFINWQFTGSSQSGDFNGLLRSDKNIILGPKMVIEYLSDEYPCNIALGRFYMWRETQGFGFPKGSPLVHLFQAGIGEMIENGVVAKLTLEQLSEKRSGTQCLETTSTSFEAIDLVTVHTSFYMLLFGVIAAALMLLMEIAVNFNRRINDAGKIHKKEQQSKSQD